MRVLLGECVDEQLRHHLPGYDYQTARYAGFARLAKSSCTTLKVFLSPWRRFFGLGLHADSSIRENARGERGLCLAGFQKNLALRKTALELTLPPHNDGAGHRVSERIACFHAQSEFL
jgi:hypothetical protein